MLIRSREFGELVVVDLIVSENKRDLVALSLTWKQFKCSKSGSRMTNMCRT